MKVKDNSDSAFSYCSMGIDDSDDLVMFEINKRILPYLLELKRNYTSYEIQNIRV